MSIRLNKLLSTRGIGARRKCDTLIADGLVTINGEVVTEPGTQVEPGRDRVEVRGRPLPAATAHRYYVLHKPIGVISTLEDPEGRRSLRDFLPSGSRVFPVGRLDADTSGLILLTNDGDLAHRLMHPRYGVVKRYRAHVDRIPPEHVLERLRRGIEFEPGEVSAPAQVFVRDQTEGDAVIEFALNEGRHRQVRKMCEAAGMAVKRLHRWGYGPLKLGQLERGLWRELSEAEVEGLRTASSRPVRRPEGQGFTGRRSFDHARPRPRAAAATPATAPAAARPARPRPVAERPARGERGATRRAPRADGVTARRPDGRSTPARSERRSFTPRPEGRSAPARSERRGAPVRPERRGAPVRSERRGSAPRPADRAAAPQRGRPERFSAPEARPERSRRRSGSPSQRVRPGPRAGGGFAPRRRAAAEGGPRAFGEAALQRRRRGPNAPAAARPRAAGGAPAARSRRPGGPAPGRDRRGPRRTKP